MAALAKASTGMASALAAEVEARKGLESAEEALLVETAAEASVRIDERVKDDAVAAAASAVSEALLVARKEAR
eukprot:281185-Prorocentrum_minimum.AAC.1